MNAAFLITFREGLEAALIVGILFTAMRALGAQKKSFVLWIGVFLGLLLSCIFAWVFLTFTSGFEGTSEKIYEGVLMFGAGAIITHLIFWMKEQGRDITKKLKKKVSESVELGTWWMIGVLATIAVAREGIETVIFFQALMVQSDTTISVISGILGLSAAIALAVVIFFSTKKVPVQKLFHCLSCALIFMAGGLIAHGVVELQGAGIIPTFMKPLYDLSLVLSEKEGLGAILKASFGYDANPSLIAVIVYWLYLGIVGRMYFKKF